MGCIKRFADLQNVQHVGHFADIRKKYYGWIPLSTSPVGSLSPSYCTTHLGEFHQTQYILPSFQMPKKRYFWEHVSDISLKWQGFRSRASQPQNGVGVDYATAFARVFQCLEECLCSLIPHGSNQVTKDFFMGTFAQLRT